MTTPGLRRTRRGQGVLLALAVATAVTLVGGGVVLARSGAQSSATVGDSGPNRLIGTAHSDVINGRGGADLIRGRGGPDVLKGGRAGDRIGGGKGFDRLLGGRGGDRIAARDGRPDEIQCGAGRDIAIVGRSEDGVFDCERVRIPK